MMNCLCRHKVFSLLYMKGNDLIDDVEMKTSGNDDRNLGERLVMQQFDTCLLCEDVNNFVSTKIRDFSCDFIKREEIVAMNDMLLPPPRYQDKLKKNNKRFRSLGEYGVTSTSEKSRATSTRYTVSSKQTSHKSYTKSNLKYIDELVNKEYFNIYSDNRIQKVDESSSLSNLFGDKSLNMITNRKSCGYCGESTHNISKCPTVLSGYRPYILPKTIKSGVWMRYKLNAILPISNKFKNLLKVNVFNANDESRDILPPIIDGSQLNDYNDMKLIYEDNELNETSKMICLKQMNENSNGDPILSKEQYWLKQNYSSSDEKLDFNKMIEYFNHEYINLINKKEQEYIVKKRMIIVF